MARVVLAALLAGHVRSVHVTEATSLVQAASCPDDCNAHGSCRDGLCFCFAGWQGPSCAVRDCSPCIHGACVNGTCQCDEGFSGSACRWPACPADCSGRGACVEGQCLCEDGWMGADCALGPCPNLCSGNGVCQAGGCKCADGFNGRCSALPRGTPLTHASHGSRALLACAPARAAVTAL